MANKLSERIIISRKSKGLKQKQLANILKISLPTMNHYESGKRAPNSELLAQIAKTLGCDPGWLLTGEGQAEKKETHQKNFLVKIIQSVFHNMILVEKELHLLIPKVRKIHTINLMINMVKS